MVPGIFRVSVVILVRNPCDVFPADFLALLARHSVRGLTLVRTNSPGMTRRGCSETILGGVPNTKYGHRVRTGDAIDNEVRRHDHQFPSSSQTSRSTATGEHHQTVTREQEFTSDPSGCNRVVRSYVANDPADIGQRLCTPDNRQDQRGFGGEASNSPLAMRSNHARTSSCGALRGSASDSAIALAKAFASVVSSSISGLEWVMRTRYHIGTAGA